MIDSKRIKGILHAILHINSQDANWKDNKATEFAVKPEQKSYGTTSSLKETSHLAKFNSAYSRPSNTFISNVDGF